MNKFLMLGIAGLAFTACTNEEIIDNGLTQGTKQVTVTIKAASNEIGTKAEMGDFTASSATAIKADDIDIYFLDAEGNIAEKRNISEGTQSEGGYIFHQVNSTVTQIAAVGNYDPNIATGAFTQVQDAAVTVNDYQTSAANVPIYAAPVALKPAGTDEHGNMYTASLTLSTKMSRIELGGSLNCTNLGTAYSQLDLSYIGLNKTPLTYTLSSGVSVTLYEANSNATGWPVLAEDATKTPDNFYDQIFTGEEPNITYPISLTTANEPVKLGKAYGFNFANSFNLYLRFEPTIVPNSTLLPNDPAYLKVVALKKTGEQGNLAIQPGYIYQIKDLEFEEEDLTPLVKDEICVTAIVSVTPWKIETVEPVYGE